MGELDLSCCTQEHVTDRDNIQGVVAIIFFTLLTFGSFRTLRNRAYELFLLSHMVMVFMYLVACWLHWDKFSYWVYVSN